MQAGELLSLFGCQPSRELQVQRETLSKKKGRQRHEDLISPCVHTCAHTCTQAKTQAHITYLRTKVYSCSVRSWSHFV